MMLSALFGFYATQNGNSVTLFRENPSLKMGLIGCPKMSVLNYHSSLRKILEERRSHLHRGRSLKSRIF